MPLLPRYAPLLSLSKAFDPAETERAMAVLGAANAALYRPGELLPHLKELSTFPLTGAVGDALSEAGAVSTLAQVLRDHCLDASLCDVAASCLADLCGREHAPTAAAMLAAGVADAGWRS